MFTTPRAIEAELARRAIPSNKRPKPLGDEHAQVAFRLLRAEMEFLLREGDLETRIGYVELIVAPKPVKAPRKAPKAPKVNAELAEAEAKLAELRKQIAELTAQPVSEPVLNNAGERKAVYRITRLVWDAKGDTSRRVNGQFRTWVLPKVADKASTYRSVGEAFTAQQEAKGVSVSVVDVQFMAWA